MNTSFQLFSSRAIGASPDFLSHLKGLGFTQVEGFHEVFVDPAAFRATLDEIGLTMPSGHFGILDLENEWDKFTDVARTLGISLLVVPFLAPEDRPKTTAGYADLAHRMERIAQRAAGEGFTVAWHNHEFEFEPTEEGDIPLDVIMTEAPSLLWEADLAWVQRGGQDPAAWLSKYGARIAAIHVKDIAPEGENLDQDGWTDVGSGVVDWKTLCDLQAAHAPDALMVMEHDNPKDVAQFAENAIGYLSQIRTK